jgi:hypothetical protein
MIALLCGLFFSLLMLGVSIKTEYGTSTALTNTVASLASSSTWLAGYQSDVVDNTTNKYLDYTIEGKYTVGTSPTASTEIRIYIVASFDGSTWPDTITGAGAAAKTITSAGVATGFIVLAKRILVDATTSNRAYPFSIGSVASFFGGVCPPKFVLFTAHNTGVNLNSTSGNQVTNVRGTYATSA